MAQMMRFLSTLISIYMMIIIVRIMLTWFSGNRQSEGLQGYLARITDPYLGWFSRFPIFRVGFMDLSPVVAVALLSVASRICGTIAIYNKITIGIILSMVLQAIWGMISFLLGFMIVILVIRLVFELLKLNSGGPLWRIVDVVSQPVIFRINRLFFKNRILTFTTSIIISVAALGIVYFVLKVLVMFVSGLLLKFPV